MEQQLQLFEHEQFGKIRVITIEGDPWFVAADVCRALALGNVSQALSRLYDKEKSFANIPARGIISIDTQGGEQKMLIVNEPGLYRLIFASRKKEAIDFQDWVYTKSCRPFARREVIPLLSPPPNVSPILTAAQVSLKPRVFMCC